ncbi:peroxiredoxin [Phormidium sp. CLA17]|nr:peroxiredoxin [Leptolyngbya sp. Cla-17]
MVRSLFSSVLALCLMMFSVLSPASAAHALGGPLPPLNQPAPEFSLPSNISDRAISLKDYRGKWVVAYFYPKDFTSGCTLEAQRFQADLPKYLSKNTQILGISVDSVDSHVEFCDSEGLKFPLLADEDGAVSKAYGAWLAPMSLRNTYIVDPTGVLRATFTGVRPVIHSAEVLQKLDELQQVG